MVKSIGVSTVDTLTASFKVALLLVPLSNCYLCSKHSYTKYPGKLIEIVCFNIQYTNQISITVKQSPSSRVRGPGPSTGL